jgi:hypothetical protein
MAEQYFYAVNGHRNGPIPFEALRDLATKGELKRSAKVWCRGMKQWEPAASVPSLFDELPPDLGLAASPTTLPPLPPDDRTSRKSGDLWKKAPCVPTPAAVNFMKAQRNIFIAGFPSGLLLLVLAAVFSSDGSESDGIGVAICTLLGLGAIIVAVVNWMMLHYRCWKLLPPTIAETTPGKAVGFYFIPLFNLYWCFVTFKGLATSANKTLTALGQVGPRCNEGLAMAFSVASAGSLSLGCMFPVLGALATVAAYVLWIVWYADLAKAFAVIESRARQSCPAVATQSQLAPG